MLPIHVPTWLYFQVLFPTLTANITCKYILVKKLTKLFWYFFMCSSHKISVIKKNYDKSDILSDGVQFHNVWIITSNLKWQTTPKATIMHTFHSNLYGCKWPMKKSYEKHWKAMLHLVITYRKRTCIIEFGTLDNSKKFITQQVFCTKYIHGAITPGYMIILPSSISYLNC